MWELPTQLWNQTIEILEFTDLRVSVGLSQLIPFIDLKLLESILNLTYNALRKFYLLKYIKEFTLLKNSNYIFIFTLVVKLISVSQKQLKNNLFQTYFGMMMDYSDKNIFTHNSMMSKYIRQYVKRCTLRQI